MTKVRIKICCISSQEEAQMAMDFGADALGFVGEMPSGPGIIGDHLIKNISQRIPPPIATFLLTSKTTAIEIIAHYNKVHTTTIQLVDKVAVDQLEIVKRELPYVKLVQVIHVLGEQSIQEAKYISKYVDALLLDSGNPNLAIKELGGTGRTHNWEISKKINEAIDIPLFLAGGLNATNVAEAIKKVAPFGVDLCSGVRTDGKMDKIKMAAYFAAIQNM